MLSQRRSYFVTESLKSNLGSKKRIDNMIRNTFFTIADKFWQNTKKSDDKRIATLTEPEGIKRICNLAYIDDGDKYHMLDVYYPENVNEKMPVIIDIHGGGWMYGDKELNKIYCLNLAKRGFVVFNISYRLVPTVTVNEQLQDCAKALKWISEHMNEYPCDSDNIMLTGDSAGGHLAAFSAVLMTNSELREIFDVVDCNMNLTALTLTSPVADMNPGGPLGIYTTAMWGEDYKQKPTYPYMNFSDIMDMGQLPPTCLITSSGDFIAIKQTRHFAKLMKAKNIPSKLLDFDKFEGENLPHVFSVILPESKAGKIAIDTVIRYYNDCISAKQTITK